MNFVKTIMLLLLFRSAKTPAPDEKIKKGITNTAPARERIAFAEAGPLRLINK